MESREIIKRTLEYENPERVARSFLDSDIVIARALVDTSATEWRKAGTDDWKRTDEWGNSWRRLDPTSKGEVDKAVIRCPDDIDSYIFPDYSKEKYYDNVKMIRNDIPDKWLVGFLPGFTFSIAREMLKLQTYLENLMLERDSISRLHDRIDDVIESMIIKYGESGCDSILFGEDWGTQTQTLISPELWYTEFYPRYERLICTAHEIGMKVFMHSCGAINILIPGLIDSGVDVLQLDQPELVGIDMLSSLQEKSKITFWSPVDIQKTLQTRDESAIRGKAREMLDKLWKGRGGFIAKLYEDNASIGLEPVWQEYACDEFVNRGKKEFYN
jgi:uroporphyrinogen decarboxylase